MCEFCKVETFNGKADMTNDIGGAFIGIGDTPDALGLRLYITETDKTREPILQADLYALAGIGSIARVDIPIKYCPNCCRKLV